MSRKTMFAALFATVNLLFAMHADNAITITLDNPNATVVRPTTGSVIVDFTGTITTTPGFEMSSFAASSLWNAAGDLIGGMTPNPTWNLTGILFSVTVDSTDLGLYAFDSSFVNLAGFNFSESPIGGGWCNNTGFTHYSVNVIDSIAVPEPSLIALLAIGFMGFMFGGRKLRR